MITLDDVINAWYAYERTLRENICWIMSQKTANELIELKESNGQQLVKQKLTLFDRPIFIDNSQDKVKIGMIKNRQVYRRNTFDVVGYIDKEKGFQRGEPVKPEIEEDEFGVGLNCLD